MHQPVSSLNLPEFKIQELQSCGLNLCRDVDASCKQLQSKLSACEWKKLMEVPQTKSALDIYQEECVAGTVSTSSKALDELLGGGAPVGLITEFCGEPGSGKTQLCLHLSVSVQFPLWHGGLMGEAVYICTNKSFSSHRLKEIALDCVNRYTCFQKRCFESSPEQNVLFDVESVLRKVHYISLDDHIELIAVVKYLQKWLEDHASVRLVVVDSISAPLKFIGFHERTHVMHKILRDLQGLSKKYKFAIVVTNDMTTRMEADNVAYHTPSLGGSYYHRINNRVKLGRKSATLYEATILKNVLQKQKTVEFRFCN